MTRLTIILTLKYKNKSNLKGSGDIAPMVEYLHKPPGAFYTSTIRGLVKDPGDKREATIHDA